MGVKAELATEDLADGIHVRVLAQEGAEVLAGPRHGGVVESITYLVNKAINRDEVGRKWVFVEVPGEVVAAPGSAAAAPVAVDPAMRAMAQELVGKAKAMGGALWVGPLPASRRGLQAALSAEPGVRVRAEGEGVHRRLCIEVA
jgi:predicted RNA-binding protein Jag